MFSALTNLEHLDLSDTEVRATPSPRRAGGGRPPRCLPQEAPCRLAAAAPASSLARRIPLPPPLQPGPRHGPPSQPQVGNAGAFHLARLRKLRRLGLCDTDVGDGAVAALTGLVSELETPTRATSAAMC